MIVKQLAESGTQCDNGVVLTLSSKVRFSLARSGIPSWD